jgi:transposase
MQDIFKMALGVEDPWFIVSTEFDAVQKRLDIRLDFKRGSRFRLEDGDGNEGWYTAYDTVEKTWRHLNFFQHECYLHVRVPRVENDEGRVIMVMPPWAGKLSGFTLLFEALLIQLCKHMPVHQVARMTGVSNYKLWRMLDLYVEAARYDEDCSAVTAVGMDETSVAKGHEYISLFVDMNQRKTLHIAEGKDSDTVKEFVEYLTEHGGKPEQITDVSCDMSPAFIKGVNDNLPNAEITFDKFHILKIINEAVDEVRREEAKTNPLLKKTRYIFLKNDKNLTEKQREKKEELQLADLNLRSMEALRMRETFQQIYSVLTETQFVACLQKWVDWVKNCGLQAMEKAARTVVHHWDGIVHWKKSQLNNGILEGLNSIIQAAKRKARGYGPKHFATIAFLLTGKLDLAKVNPHVPT